MRVAVCALALLLGGCATSSGTTLKDVCEKNPAHDPKCIEELTAVQYESREEVMRREEQRKEDHETSRLARMRREEEARQAARVATGAASTKSATVADKLAPEDEAVLSASQASSTKEENTETGSSVRALVATHVDKKAVREAPTPEEYLRAGLCLLGEDVARMRGVLAVAKKAGKHDAGALALAILDGDALLSLVKAEISHRGLPIAGNGICAADSTQSVVDLLRELVGPPVTKDSDAEPYGRGLGRLRRELEVRAGLPKSE